MRGVLPLLDAASYVYATLTLTLTRCWMQQATRIAVFSRHLFLPPGCAIRSHDWWGLQPHMCDPTAMMPLACSLSYWYLLPLIT
jgi:hypothetical protein